MATSSEIDTEVIRRRAQKLAARAYENDASAGIDAVRLVEELAEELDLERRRRREVSRRLDAVIAECEAGLEVSHG